MLTFCLQCTTVQALMLQKRRNTTVVHFYNQSKIGVNVFDQMAKKYTTQTASRRLPFAISTNLLDIAALNSWILYRTYSGSNISRRNVTSQHIESLRKANVMKRKQVMQREVDPVPVRPSGK